MQGQLHSAIPQRMQTAPAARCSEQAPVNAGQQQQLKHNKLLYIMHKHAVQCMPDTRSNKYTELPYMLAGSQSAWLAAN